MLIYTKKWWVLRCIYHFFLRGNSQNSTRAANLLLMSQKEIVELLHHIFGFINVITYSY